MEPQVDEVLTGHKGAVYRCFWGEATLLSCSDDRTARVWRVPTEAAAASAMPVDAAAAEGANLCDED